MKKFITLLFISIFCSIPVFSQEHLKIKGVPIDGNVNTFITKMKGAGLKYDTRLSDALERPILVGEFADLGECKFSVLCTTNNTVCKVLIITDDIGGWYSTKSKYKDIKERLSSKYEIVKSFEYFSSPYYEGDGYELSAIRQDKGTYVTFFHCDEGYITLEIKATNSSAGYLTLVYEDTANMKIFSEEREKRIGNDL